MVEEHSSKRNSGIKNDKPVWDSWKCKLSEVERHSAALSPRNRMVIAGSVFVFSAIGLYVSDRLEEKYPAVNPALLQQQQQQQQQKQEK
ncbi:hypothetical protein E3Q06_01417 [Wallemia mellicola]|nr:hypothetical protein E3Q21_01520 [Wallemia mellicola]TIB89805.1 hypothetical protein E3Q20_01503 [Wallemia mellicola]TIC41819.1 hypothetical protein E3Q07_01420 [Wallemia mellicola]TIC50410.1 hypothetical protein E3Q06_01417 [Wallemia mellicola]